MQVASAAAPTVVQLTEPSVDDEHDAAFYAAPAGADVVNSSARADDERVAEIAGASANSTAASEALAASSSASATSSDDEQPASMLRTLADAAAMIWRRVGEPYVRGAAIGLGLVLVHYVFARHLIKVRH